MRFVFYTQSVISDWNHGNAHFLRGVMRELLALGHEALALEAEDSWSRKKLMADQGSAAVARFHDDFPELTAHIYGTGFNHEEALSNADVVIVHEWTDPALVARIGRVRGRGGEFTLLFHDTHHRAVSAEPDIAALRLSDYDCVLAFGESLRQRYLKAGWGNQVVTWHEAADTRLFRSIPEMPRSKDLIWIGNWGDDERSAEIHAFLIKPARRLGVSGSVRGVRYPRDALAALQTTDLEYGGWIANADAPVAFAQHRATLHIPRRHYVDALPGIPTIRMFEALACGIPLISAPWEDAENLFRPGKDFLFARNGEELTQILREILPDGARRSELAGAGLETIKARHTCRHRANELLAVIAKLGTLRARQQLTSREAAE